MANVPAAAACLALLRLLAAHAEPQPAAAIARSLGIPRSTAYHLLALLRDEGFVVHLEKERRYALGIAVYELGSAYLRRAPLQRLAGPYLARLVDRTGYTGHLAILQGRDVLYLIEQRAAGRPLLITEEGVRLPAHLTASGQAMLAALPRQQVKALYPGRDLLTRRHATGPTTLAVLQQELREVRRVGYATEDGRITEDSASVGCVILDHQGYPQAALALTYPRHERPQLDQLAQLIGQTVGAISRRLGKTG